MYRQFFMGVALVIACFLVSSVAHADAFTFINGSAAVGTCTNGDLGSNVSVGPSTQSTAQSGGNSTSNDCASTTMSGLASYGDLSAEGHVNSGSSTGAIAAMTVQTHDTIHFTGPSGALYRFTWQLNDGVSAVTGDCSIGSGATVIAQMLSGFGHEVDITDSTCNPHAGPDHGSFVLSFNPDETIVINNSLVAVVGITGAHNTQDDSTASVIVHIDGVTDGADYTTDSGFNYETVQSETPEPATGALMISGMAGILIRRKRRAKILQSSI